MITPAERDADRWWDGARERERDFLLGTGGLRRRPGPAEARARLRQLASPWWIPERRPPRLPSRWEIASYWHGLGPDSWFDVDIDNPHCFGCGLGGALRDTFPEEAVDAESRWHYARRLERSHIVNRAFNGLDALQNLVMLCGSCNRRMPDFRVQEEDDAVAWINNGGALRVIEARLRSRLT